MAGLVEIRQAIADTLTADPDVPAHVFWFRPDAINDDGAVVVTPQSKVTDTMGRGWVTYTFVLEVVAPFADDEAGQYALDNMLDGIDRALFSGRVLLGGDARLNGASSWGNYGTQDIAGATHWSADVETFVITQPERRT